MGDIISKKKKLVEPFHANGGFFGSLRDGQGMIKQFMAYKLDKVKSFHVLKLRETHPLPFYVLLQSTLASSCH